MKIWTNVLPIRARSNHTGLSTFYTNIFFYLRKFFIVRLSTGRSKFSSLIDYRQTWRNCTPFIPFYHYLALGSFCVKVDFPFELFQLFARSTSHCVSDPAEAKIQK